MKRCAGGIEYELTRKAVKNLNLRLRPDGSVTVSIPKRVTLAEADRFVEQNADRIRQAGSGWTAVRNTCRSPRSTRTATGSGCSVSRTGCGWERPGRSHSGTGNSSCPFRRPSPPGTPGSPDG